MVCNSVRRVEGSRTLTSRRNAPLRPLRIIRAYSLRYKNPVCLHAIGFLLLASSIPRTIVHCLLPTSEQLRRFTPPLISLPYSLVRVTSGVRLLPDLLKLFILCFDSADSSARLFVSRLNFPTLTRSDLFA